MVTLVRGSCGEIFEDYCAGRAYGGAFTAASHGDREAAVANVTLASFCNCCRLTIVVTGHWQSLLR